MMVQTRRSALTDSQDTSILDVSSGNSSVVIESNESVSTVCDELSQPVGNDPSLNTSINDAQAANLSINSYCYGCAKLATEIDLIRKEVENLKTLSFNFPANAQRSTSSNNMQIIDCLEKNNAILLERIDALFSRSSSQVTANSPTEKPSSVTNPLNSQTKKKNKKKKKKPKGDSNKTNEKVPTATSDQTNVQTNGQSNGQTNGQSNAQHGSQSRHSGASDASGAAPIITNSGAANKKESVVIAGDSIVKGLIGHKMSRSDQDHYYIVKPFSGATSSDMEHYVKPLIQKRPDKLILHVGTNDLRSSSSPKSIADSIFKLVKQIRKDSPSTRIGVSAILVRNDSKEASSKVGTVNNFLSELCTSNHIDFLDNSNITTSHLNSRALHLNKEGSLVLESNFQQFASIIEF